MASGELVDWFYVLLFRERQVLKSLPLMILTWIYNTCVIN
jgi:hypothetical protein